MNVKEKYISPEIHLAEIKENVLELEVSGKDNVTVNLFSARKDLFESGNSGSWFDGIM